MGGLIIAGLLADAGEDGATPGSGRSPPRGSPFRGSFEAVIKVAVGAAALGLGEESSRDREARAREILQAMLDEARVHRDALEALRPERSGLTRDDWLSIIGVGKRTGTELRIEERDGGPRTWPGTPTGIRLWRGCGRRGRSGRGLSPFPTGRVHRK